MHKRLFLYFGVLVFLVIQTGCERSLSKEERATACLDATQSIMQSAPQVIGMKMSGKTDAEVQAFSDALLAKVAEKHGLDPVQMINICGDVPATTASLAPPTPSFFPQEPVIDVLSSQDNQGSSTEYLLEFIVSDAEEVLVNDVEVAATNGRYTQLIPLKTPSTRIKIEAKKGLKKGTAKFYIERAETDSEKTERLAALDRERQRLRDESAAAQKAARRGDEAWMKSKAGRLCEKHPDWTKTDCDRVSEQRYWVGMTYEMLVEGWGKPTSANPSDYGSGIQWQWCWLNYTPSCFYDDNGDGIIDSYN